MPSEVINQIENLKRIYLTDESREELNAWQTTVKKALLLQGLYESDGIKLIIDKYQNDIVNINEILLNDLDLTTEDRKLLMQRRKWCKEFINLFKRAESVIKDANRAVDEQMQHAQDEGLINN